VVDHIRETPQLPSGNGVRLAQYGFMLVPFLFFVIWLYAMARRAKTG